MGEAAACASADGEAACENGRAAGRPLLTIAVPSYNVEAYLERGLSTYDDPRFERRLEVIVVNDGSTAGTRSIAQTFVARRPGVFRLVDKPNGGHGSAVNAGIDAARGKYFRVIDGDDWADTGNLSCLLDRLHGIDADLVVDVKCEVDMRTGARTLFPLPPDVPLGVSLPFEQACGRDDMASLIMVHTLMIRTDYVRSVGLRLLEKTFYVDFEYVVKATLDAGSVQFLDVNVYQYLVGNAAQSVADENYVRRWDDHERVTREMLAFYERRSGNLDDVRRDYLRRRCELIVNTHYNIALIFDKDRRRGVRRAKEFRAWLHAEHPEIAAATDKRYRQASLLHHLGVDSQKKLDRLRG